MKIDDFKKNIRFSHEYSCCGSNIYLSNLSVKKGFLGNAITYSTLAFVVLNEKAVEIKGVLDSIVDSVLKSSETDKIKIHLNCIIFSDYMDKFSYQSIAIPRNLKYRNMNNQFCILNLATGEAFFNPDSIENGVLTERLSALKKKYNTSEINAIQIELGNIIDILTEIMNNKRRHGN